MKYLQAASASAKALGASVPPQVHRHCFSGIKVQTAFLTWSVSTHLRIAQKLALWKTEGPGLGVGTTSAPAAPPFYQLRRCWSAHDLGF